MYSGVPGVLLPDRSMLPPDLHPELPRVGPVVCVEVKPKAGFMPTSPYVKAAIKRKLPRFVLHQLLKHVKVWGGGAGGCTCRLCTMIAAILKWVAAQSGSRSGSAKHMKERNETQVHAAALQVLYCLLQVGLLPPYLQLGPWRG